MFTVAEQLTSDPGSLSAYFDGSQELLHTIAGVLDIRSVFPRVSEIARKMLPHDALTMSCQDEDLNVHLEASSNDDVRGLMSDLAGVPMAPELLIGDLRKETFPLSERSYWRERMDARGYRSLLRVAIPARDRAGRRRVLVQAGACVRQPASADRPPNRRSSRRRGVSRTPGQHGVDDRVRALTQGAGRQPHANLVAGSGFRTTRQTRCRRVCRMARGAEQGGASRQDRYDRAGDRRVRHRARKSSRGSSIACRREARDRSSR